MNFVIYVVIFVVSNFGLWFFCNFIVVSWFWVIWVIGGWVFFLLIYGVYIFVFVDYIIIFKDFG